VNGWNYVCSYTKLDGTRAKAASMMSGDHTGRDSELPLDAPIPPAS
jgi:hypothetical protein